MPRRSIVVAVLSLAALPLALLAPARADEALKNIFKRSAPATVSIETLPDAEGNIALGSGSFLDPAGIVLTNHHVVEKSLSGDRRVQVRLFDGREFWGKVIEADEGIDLALVHVEDSPGGFPILELGDSEAVEVGDDVLAIGNPDGLSWSLSTGVISGRRGDLLQTTTPLNPGNSGGPLISMGGSLVGVNTFSMYEGRDNIAFARASNAVRAWLAKMGMGGGPPRPPTRAEAAESDFSFLPPEGWEPMDARGPGVLFSRKAPAGDGGRSPGYLEVKRVDLSRDGQVTGLLGELKMIYADKYTDVETQQERVFDYGGGHENAAILEVSYRGRSISLVESNLLLLGESSIYVVKFVVQKTAWEGVSSAAYETFRSVRWAGAATKGTGPYSSPERAVQALVDAARAGDIDRLFAALHPVVFFDRLTNGKFSRTPPEDQRTLLSGYRERFQQELASGDFLGDLDRGVAVVAGGKDGESASVELVTTLEDGTKVARKVELARLGEDWKVAAISTPYPLDPESVPKPSGGQRTKKFSHPDGLFSIDVPVDWSETTVELQAGSKMYLFMVGESPDSATEMLFVQTVPRQELSGRVSLDKPELESLRQSIAENVGKAYTGMWKVTGTGSGKLAGQDAVHFEFDGKPTPIAPLVHGRMTITFHRGVIFVVQIQHLDGASPETRKMLERMQETLKIPG